MKNAGLSLFALAAIAAVPLLAAAQEGGQSSPPASPAAVPVPTTSAPAQPGNAATTTADFMPVKAELLSKLDSKSAKPGDAVVVKTRENVKTSDGTEIPKGSRLMGHITKVQAHSNTSQNSELALLFDQAQLKSGQTVAIHSTIQSVGTPQGSGQPADAMSSAPMASPGGAPGGGSMSNSRGSSSGSPAQPSVPSTQATTASADQSSGSGNGSTAGRVVAGSGPTAIRTTDIPNVYLASNATLQDSGVLFAAKDNVHLDGGTQIVLDIAPASSR